MLEEGRSLIQSAFFLPFFFLTWPSLLQQLKLSVLILCKFTETKELLLLCSASLCSTVQEAWTWLRYLAPRLQGSVQMLSLEVVCQVVVAAGWLMKTGSRQQGWQSPL